MPFQPDSKEIPSNKVTQYIFFKIFSRSIAIPKPVATN